MPEDEEDDRPFGGDILKYLEEVNNRLYKLMTSPRSNGTFEIPLTFRDFPSELSHRHPFRKPVGINKEAANRRQYNQSGQGGVSNKTDQKQKILLSCSTSEQLVEPIKPNTKKDLGSESLSSRNKIVPPNIGDNKKYAGPAQSTKQEPIIPDKDVRKNINSGLTARKEQLPETQSHSQNQKRDVEKKKDDITSTHKKDKNKDQK